MARPSSGSTTRLNPRLAHGPARGLLGLRLGGYAVPEWPRRIPGPRRQMVDLVVPKGPRPGPARPGLPLRPGSSPPSGTLLVVHDGGDYLAYAAPCAPVPDNLIHRLDMAPVVAAFLTPRDRLVEYANHAPAFSVRGTRTAALPDRTAPAARGSAGLLPHGASFGGIASLAAAVRYPDAVGSLLLQSASLVFTDIGHDHGGGPAFDPVVKFVNRFRAAPSAPVDRFHVLRHLRAAHHSQPVDGPVFRSAGWTCCPSKHATVITGRTGGTGSGTACPGCSLARRSSSRVRNRT